MRVDLTQGYRSAASQLPSRYCISTQTKSGKGYTIMRQKYFTPRQSIKELWEVHKGISFVRGQVYTPEIVFPTKKEAMAYVEEKE